jgi:hypothetical protein
VFSKEAIELLTETVLKAKEFCCTFCNTFSSDKKESLKNHIGMLFLNYCCSHRAVLQIFHCLVTGTFLSISLLDD